MRKNKTYEQQTKFYNKDGRHESLGEMFICWLRCDNIQIAAIQKTFREGTKECKEYIIEDLYHLCDKKLLYQFIRIFYFGKK